MLRGYPNKAERPYLAALAEELQRYPREVAVDCAKNLASKMENNFPPAVPNVAQYCRPMAESMWRKVKAAEDERAAIASPGPTRGEARDNVARMWAELKKHMGEAPRRRELKPGMTITWADRVVHPELEVFSPDDARYRGPYRG